ncbi:hypothetical protein GCM10029964_010050 [Kibdelosporangium lantanae]
MADFTNPVRTDQHQLAMRRGLNEALETAFGKIGVRWNSCHHEDRGDGAVVVLPPGFPRVKIFELLPNLLLVALIRHNALHVEAARIRLRMAVHSGEVATDANGLVGTAVNDTFRILDSSQAKTDLRESAGVLGIIVSETIFHDVIEGDPAVEPGTFKQVAVAVKHTRTTAWMRIYGTVADQSRVLPGFQEEAIGQLRELVGELIFPDLPTVLARAVGPGVPPLGRKANAWEMVKYVLDLNANPGGLPKLIAFVELLADHVGGALAAALRSWNNTQAGQLQLTAALDELRTKAQAAVPADNRLHLVIVVEHDLFDDDHCLVSHWRQDDPTEWRPARGSPDRPSCAILNVLLTTWSSTRRWPGPDLTATPPSSSCCPVHCSTSRSTSGAGRYGPVIPVRSFCTTASSCDRSNGCFPATGTGSGVPNGGCCPVRRPTVECSSRRPSRPTSLTGWPRCCRTVKSFRWCSANHPPRTRDRTTN